MSEFTDFLRVTFKALLAENGPATTMGFVFGIVLHMVVLIFSPSLAALTFMSLTHVTIGHYIALGVFLFNLPHFLRRNKFPVEVEQALKMIDLQRKQGVITKAERKMRNRQLLDQMIARVEFNPQMKAQIKALEDMLASDDEPMK